MSKAIFSKGLACFNCQERVDMQTVNLFCQFPLHVVIQMEDCHVIDITYLSHSIQKKAKSWKCSHLSVSPIISNQAFLKILVQLRDPNSRKTAHDFFLLSSKNFFNFNCTRVNPKLAEKRLSSKKTAVSGEFRAFQSLWTRPRRLLARIRGRRAAPPKKLQRGEETRVSNQTLTGFCSIQASHVFIAPLYVDGLQIRYILL